MKHIIDKLDRDGILNIEELKELLSNCCEEDREYLFEKAREKSRSFYGNKVYSRGLIEFTNYCRCNCYYCGIRAGNSKADRYRLTKEEILSCCREGYSLGFRTFVLQGGEDMYYSDEDYVDIIKSIKELYPDCAITLSIGERSYSSYKKYREAGADRYLLRHETFNSDHYGKLHPKEQTAENRQKCLKNLKDLGYQVGTGIMVGSPYQTIDNIIEDLMFIKDLQPEMVGIGPFLPHQDTPFRDEQKGSYELTLLLIGVIRLMLPKALIPSTTALGTINPLGREKGILAGANVVMPNLSPVAVRKKYSLYDNKICTGEEAAECRQCLSGRMRNIGYEIVAHRGDYIDYQKDVPSIGSGAIKHVINIG